MPRDEEPLLTPSERFHALLDGIGEDRLAEIDAKLRDPNYVPPEVELRDDPDPFGRAWDWLTPGVEEI